METAAAAADLQATPSLPWSILWLSFSNSSYLEGALETQGPIYSAHNSFSSF